MKKGLFLGLVLSGLLIFSSCGPSEVMVSSRPEPPYYSRPMSPGPGYVWINGDWYARSGRYHWREGYWRRSGNRVWISGNWQSRPNGYYWRRGYWGK
ncbi:MAG: YXWGXW repeat-containing protein [Chitinophagales bacterium]